MPPPPKTGWTVGTLALLASKCIENMELGHNITHGQWDWMNDPEIHSNTWEWDMAGPSSQWRYSHNYRHHVFTNVIGMDDDLGYGVLRVSRDQEWMPSYLLAPLRAVLLSMIFEWGIALHDLYAEQEHQQTEEGKAELKRATIRKMVRDVIFVSQHGTLHADPLLTCPESDHFVAESRSLSMLAPAAAQRSLDAVRACHDRLASKGYNLSAYNTFENAADMADVRTAMDIDSWHVYGVSYGTDLALQLVRDHPEGISSVVLDSVVPPQNNLLTHLWGSAAGGFKAVFDACAAQPRCAGAYPDLENEFTTTVRRLAKNPMTVDVPASADSPAQRVVIDGYKFANLVVLKSMDSNSYAALPQMIHATAVGDGRAAGAAVQNSVPSVDLMSYGLRYGVMCREAAPFTTPDAIAADAQKALPGFPAEVLAIQPQFGRMMDDCQVWNVGRADPTVNQPVQSDIPVLLLAGTFDAITQPSQADDAAATLTHSRVVRFGHRPRRLHGIGVRTYGRGRLPE